MYEVAGSLVLVAGILLVIIWRQVRRPNFPPGPWGLPLLGNSLQIDHALPHLQLTAWAKKYRDFYKVRLYGHDVIVLCSSELIRHAAVSNSDAFAGRPASVRQRPLEQYGVFSLIHCDMGAHWRRMKKVVVNALKLHGERLARLEEVTLEEIGHLLEEFKVLKGQLYDPWEDLHRAITIIMFKLTFGSRLSHKEADHLIRLEEQTGTQTHGKQSRRYFIRYHNKRIHHIFHHDIRKTYHEPLQVRKNRVFHDIFDTEQVGCVADALFHHNLLSNVDNMVSDDDIRATMRDLNEAAVAPTTVALYSILGLCVKYPDVQDQLHDVIDKAIQGQRTPRLADRKKMPYVEAVVLETCRYISQLPLGLPHKTTKVVNMNGYVLPKDTEVIFNLWSLHHDERYWEDPWVFKPERFLTPEGHVISHEHPNRRRLLGFGAGRRACIGETIAKNRLFLLLAAILKRYQLLPENRQPPDMDPHHFQSTGTGICPQRFKIRFVKRVIRQECSEKWTH